MKKRFIVFLGVGFFCGILLGHLLVGIQRDIRPLLCFGLLSVLLLQLGEYLKPFILGLCIAGVVFWGQATYTAVLGLPYGQEVTAEALVLESKPNSDAVIVSLKWQLPEVWFKVRIKVRTYLEEASPGDRLTLTGRLERFGGAVNPYGYDARQTLGAKGIRADLNVHAAEPGKRKNFDLSATFLKARQRWIDRIVAVSDYGPYWIAFVLGETDHMRPEALALMRRSGLAHALAVSGLHVGIVYGLCVIIGNRCFKKKLWVDALVFSVLFFYLILNLFSFTIWRAVFLAAYHRIGFYGQRRPDAATAITLIAIVQGVFNPYCIYDLSFLLSLGATLAIAFFYRPIKRFFAPLGETLSASLAIIFAAQLGILPIQIYVFNVFYPESVLFNLLFVPILSVIIQLAFILSFFSGFEPLLTSMSKLFDLSMGVCENALWRIGNLWEWPVIMSGLDALLCIVILLLTVAVFSVKRGRQVFLLIGLCAVVILPSLVLSRNACQITCFSIGKADAILIQNQGKAVMIDTAEGKIDFGSLLLKNDVKVLEALIVTHEDLDHAGGVSGILDQVEAKSVVRGLEGPTNLTAGEMILTCFYGDKTHSDNNASIVVLLKKDDFGMLLMGDAEVERENQLIEADALPKIAGVKIAHHGSRTSTQSIFLETVKPRFAVISGDGTKNFPNEEILERLKDCGILVYRTDRHGAVIISPKADTVEIKTYLRGDHEL